MCIRDRVGVAGCAGGVLDVDGVVGQTMLHPERCFAFHLACLLYTSDAADERSSVDLGGRRILKKKTKDRHSVNDSRQTQIHTI